MAETYSSLCSLPSPIRESISPADRINLEDAHATAMSRLEAFFAGVQGATAAGLNSSIIDAGNRPYVELQHLSIGSITTIVGMLLGRPTTFLIQSIGSYNFIDVGNFVLAGNFVPTTLDSITLIWNGIQYVEVARSAN